MSAQKASVQAVASVQIQLRVSTELRDSFKAYCQYRGSDVSTELRQYMMGCIDKEDVLVESPDIERPVSTPDPPARTDAPKPSQPDGKMVPGDAPGTYVETPVPEDEKKGWPSEADMLKAASLSKKIQTAKGPERAKLLKEQARLMER